LLRLQCGAALFVLVKAALGPTALIVLVEAALGLIHSAALFKTALGPIHGVVLGRLPSPALLVEAAYGHLLGNAIGNQVGTASDVPVKAVLVGAAQWSASWLSAVLVVTVKAALGRLLSVRRLAFWPPSLSGVCTRPQ
jgi:hypothetical protein